MNVQETKAYLHRIREKECEVNQKRIKCGALRLCLLPDGIRYDVDRVQTSPESKMEEILAEVDQLEREISFLLQQQAMLIMEACHYIDQLVDETEKTALYGFYIDRRPPIEIADMIHYGLRRTYDYRNSGLLHLGEILERRKKKG